MSIKFSKTAPNPRTRIIINDSATSTIPAGDFLIGSVVTLDGSWPPTENSHILTATNGNDGEAGNIRLFLRSDSAADSGADVYPGSGIDAKNPVTLVAGASYFVGMARVGTQLRTVVCPVLTSQPTDGSAVVYSTKTRNITAGEMNPPPFVIGERSTIGATAGDRRFDNSICRVFCIVGSVPALDIAKLAYGMEPTDLGYSPLWYLRMNDGLDTADRSAYANVTSRSTGSDALPAGTSPNFGYVSVNRPPTVTAPSINGSPQVGTSVSYTSGTVDGYPYPAVTQQWLRNGVAITGATGATYIPVAEDAGANVLSVRQFVNSEQGTANATSAAVSVAAAVNAVYVTPPAVERIFQRIGTTAAVPFSVTYTGTQPSSIEYQLYDPDGTTVRVTWTDSAAQIAAGGTATASPLMPQGAKKYRIQVRTKSSNGTVIATSAVHPDRFGVGDLIAMLGSSSAMTWAYSDGGVVNNDLGSQYVSGNWSVRPERTHASKMAEYITAQRGVVVGMLSFGVGGTSLDGTTGWIAKTQDLWVGLANGVAANGGKLAGVFISVNSNDAGGGVINSTAERLALMQQFVFNLRELTGQLQLAILWSGYNRRTKTSKSQEVFDAQSNYVRMAERQIGDPASWVNGAPVYHVQTVDFELHGDGIHLTGDGFAACTLRMAQVWCDALAGNYRRGPKVTAFSYNGADVFIDVEHRNGSDLSPATGGTGITVMDANGTPAIISTSRVSATRYRATCDRVLVAPVVTKFLSGGSPDWSSPILDNGVSELPMMVETEMATTTASVEPAPDTTSPVMSGTVIATNVTSTSSNISWSVGTDDVGVTGYEYSTNGGTSYTNTGTARTAALSGLSVSTTYQLRARAYDAAGNRSAPVSGTLTTLAAPDTTIPSLAGVVTVTNVTSSSASISWSAGTDNVSVTGYEYSVNGGISYVNSGTSRTVSLTGLAATTTYQIRVRAYDAAGNKSANISGTFTTLAEDNTTTPSDIDATKVPPERRVVFEGSKRVVPFYGSINKVRF